MPQQGLVFRVLIASPGDCADERKVVRDGVHRWNASHSLATHAILEPVSWETHARPDVGDRPQAIINQQLVDTCDLLVGTFWTRLGTHTGEAESGTAEEIERLRGNGRPVLLYFSSAPVAPERLDPAQYQSLKDYKAKLQPKALYFGYESLEQLQRLFQDHLAATMASLLAGAESPAERAPNDQAAVAQEFVGRYDTFLRRLEAEWISERDSKPHNTDDGKAILAWALDRVHEFRSQIVSGLDDATALLDAAAKELRALQRHQLYMDGGRSFAAFWTTGNSLIETLKAVRPMIA
jgi:hypothetical protein